MFLILSTIDSPRRRYECPKNTMRVHFREKYGTKGEEILYVTPAGKYWLNDFAYVKID